MAAARLDEASYYDLMSVNSQADFDELQRAFHHFALAYHPDRHVGDVDVLQDAARRVFQRGVEAYTVLRNSDARALYDQCLAQGRLRLSPTEMERVSRPPPAPQPEAPQRRSAKPLVDAMTTDDGREVAERVERLLAKGRYTDAYQQLGILELIEPENPTLVKHMREVRALLKNRVR